MKNYITSNNLDSVELVAPQLAYYPEQAVSTLKNIIDDISKTQTPLIIASSMGCYFTNYLSQKLPVKACFINPAVDPFNRIDDYLNKTSIHPYTKEEFILKESDLSYLKSIQSSSASDDSEFYVYLKKGDEVLDYKLAEDLYKKHHLHIDEGGDHSFHDFEAYLPQLFKRLGLA